MAEEATPDTTANVEEPGTPPWGEDFSPARAWSTITKQREQVKDLKAQLADAHDAGAKATAVAAELDEVRKQLAERDRQLQALTTARTKEKLLADRGLPANLIDALAGDTEQDWADMADLLQALRGSGVKATPQPDPVQSATDVGMTEDAMRMAQAKAIGLA